eukprot:TRINITY_DN20297_c0_g1_i1.p1 TRINITY_DN20297_c0_g1~~TRINITY_DN20297_c0_g1_i1.p1  ORF type:complete len:412 (-),score=58.50 TRINITY_DN20297_c0_g1_i1:53-1267(-)
MANVQVPQLVIAEQNSLSLEKVGKQGKQVHVVVKGSPFVIRLALSVYKVDNLAVQQMLGKYLTNERVDLSKLTFDCALLYDLEQEKEVTFVQTKPFQFEVLPQSGSQVDSDYADLEVRLFVLSSQHENTSFKVKIIALDPLTKIAISPALQAISHPIKVISKPEQLKTRKPMKKRTVNHILIESLNRIEQYQQEQQNILNSLTRKSSALSNARINMASPPPSGNNVFSDVPYGSLERLTVPGQNDSGGAPNQLDLRQSAQGYPSTLPMISSGSNVPNLHLPNNNAPQAQSPQHVDFEDAVTNLLRLYNKMKNDSDGSEKIKAAVQSAHIDRGELVELNDLFLSEGLQRQIGTEVEHSDRSMNLDSMNTQFPLHSSCQCASCPHKVELERIEAFYKEVFHLNERK